MSSDKIKALCGVCPGGCAVVAEVKDGVLTGVEVDPESPFGNLCIRGKAAPEIVYSPDRVKTPLIRAGRRGEGKFREAGWEEALELIAKKMQFLKESYGPQSLVSHAGRGAFEQSMLDFCSGPDVLASKLLFPFGSPNIASDDSLCYTSFGSPIQAGPWRKANVNRLTDYYNRDPISGFPVFKALLCEIQPAFCKK